MKPSNKTILSLRKELCIKQNPLHTLKEIKTWYKKTIRKSKVKIKIIPLKECKSWKIDRKVKYHIILDHFIKLKV